MRRRAAVSEQGNAQWSLRWLLLPLVVGVVGLGLVLTVLLARDLVMIRGALVTAHAAMDDVRRTVETGELDRARASVANADSRLAEARSASAGPVWSAASTVVPAQAPIGVLRELIEAASATVEVLRPLLAEDALAVDALDLEMEDGRIDMDPLLAARDVLGRVDLARLAEIHESLSRPAGGTVPTTLADAREEARRGTGEALGILQGAKSAAAVLPGFLGADEPRRYFLGVQTTAELRGTGGLIGYWGVLTADAGVLDLEETGHFDPQLDEGSGGSTSRIGWLSGSGEASAPESFVERYGHVEAARSFSNVNVDPHLPTTAAVMLELFEIRAGEALDGVILLNPTALESMLVVAAQELELPDDLASAAATDAIRTTGFGDFVTQEVYSLVGSDENERRNRALRELGDEAAEVVLEGGWDGREMARALLAVHRDRHLQLYSRDETEQAAFVDLDVAGSLTPTEGADLLAVTANNAVGGKQDVLLGHAFDVEVRLEDPRRDDSGLLSVRRSATVRVGVDNPLPLDGLDEYVIGSCVRPDGTTHCFDGPPGENRTWFSLWAAGDSWLTESRSSDGQGPWSARGYRDMLVVDQHLLTSAGSSSWMEVDVDGTAPLAARAGSLVYELRWWRQSKSLPDLVDLRVRPPAGWVASSVDLEGGGSGRGSGVHGKGVDLVAEREGADARVHGTISGNAVLRVTLAPDVEGESS